MMNRILARLNFVKYYIDEIFVHINFVEEHQIHLQVMFEVSEAHCIRLHPEKCKFFQEEVEYFDHVIYPSGLILELSKIDAIAHVSHPTYMSKVQAFMRLTNEYRRYVAKI